MTGLPQCAVVIPSFDRADLIGACLEALLAHPPERCEWRVIVVGDGSDDDAVARLASCDERLTVLAREPAAGLVAARNDGARAAADADHLVFLDGDTVPLAGWLDALVDEAAEHPGAAAIGSRLLAPDGSISHAGIVIGRDRWPHHVYAGFPGEHPAASRAKPVIAATAACLLVRRVAFEQLGGFDPAFEGGYADVDLCLRLGQLGHEVRYCPGSVLYHFASPACPAGEAGRQAPDGGPYEERWLERVVPDDLERYLADGLVSVEYGDSYPIQVSISPLLAGVRRETGDDDRLERLLAIRTEQVQALRGARIQAELGRREDRRLPALSSPPAPVKGDAGDPPRVVAEGEVRRLGSARPRAFVSVLMPLKNGAAALREVLPAVLGQRADADLEIVAVDSGSSDETVEVLGEFGAKVIAIDPADFDHGLTRNLAASHARGDVLVFLNTRSRPCDENWLAPLLEALEADPAVAGACSRVLPYPDVDPLTRRDGSLDVSGSPQRAVKRIDNWRTYATMPVEQRRLLLNFHTVSAAIRADVLARIPFRSVRAIGEDLLWSREVLEAGMTLVHEPGSEVFHSHDYSLRELFMRNVDDGIANRDINAKSVSEGEADSQVRGMIASDWAYLRDELGLEGEELDAWQIQAALRRVAQGAGQWLGTNHPAFPEAAVTAFSRVADGRRSR